LNTYCLLSWQLHPLAGGCRLLGSADRVCEYRYGRW